MSLDKGSGESNGRNIEIEGLAVSDIAKRQKKVFQVASGPRLTCPSCNLVFS